MRSKFRKQKGITMIALSIAIVILVIITNMLMYSAKDNVNISKITEMNNDIKLLEGKISEYYLKHDEIPKLVEYIDIEGIELGANDTGKFYVIDLDKLPGLTLNYGKEYFDIKNMPEQVNAFDDVYIINEDTHAIFYVKGIEVSDGSTLNSEQASDDVKVEKCEVIIPGGGEWNGIINTPVIENGMIPIAYDESKGNWVVCSEQNTNNEWYNYKNQKWANIMLSDGTYKVDENNKLTKNGQLVTEKNPTVKYSELGSMFVWIPRYAYSITNGWHSSTTGKIEIQFIKKNIVAGSAVNGGTITNIAATNAQTAKEWRIPPAFTYGITGSAKELGGFYVGKFEASKNGEQLKVIPGVKSWGGNTNNPEEFVIGDMYAECVEMKQNSSYGIQEGPMDPHMMKNSEWGATAYLAHSEYGLDGSEIARHSNEYLITGGGDSVGEAGYKSNTNQSTTGNITGVYDMSGGAWEYVAAYIKTTDLEECGKTLITASSKHKDLYGKLTYEYNSNKYGDAIYETSSGENSSSAWNGDYSYFPETEHPFFGRGGHYYDIKISGLFCFSRYNGQAFEYTGFRPTISKDA